MQKDNYFTRARFEPKYFYPKKCVNYDKSTLQQNSVKGPKEPNSNINFKNVLKNATKKSKCVTLLTFLTKQHKTVQRIYPRFSIHKHCSHVRTFLHLWYNEQYTVLYTAL